MKNVGNELWHEMWEVKPSSQNLEYRSCSLWTPLAMGGWGGCGEAVSTEPWWILGTGMLSNMAQALEQTIVM